MSGARTVLNRLTAPTAITAVLMLPFFAGGCGKTEPKSTTSGQASIQAEEKPKWDYSNERGPARWGELSPDYVLAAIGGSQSPIDIVTDNVITADLPGQSPEFRYFDAQTPIYGHAIARHAVELVGIGQLM